MITGVRDAELTKIMGQALAWYDNPGKEVGDKESREIFQELLEIEEEMIELCTGYLDHGLYGLED